jgi:hypothetical protein
MSERSPEVDFDAFGPTTSEERESQTIPADDVTHYVGDSCPPDGHRAETRASEGDRVIEPEPFAAAVDAARAYQETVFEPPREEARPPTKNVTPTPTYPIAVIWGSRTGGAGHVCAIIGTTPEGGPVLRCTCEAGVLGSHDCWAMTATRRIL